MKSQWLVLLASALLFFWFLGGHDVWAPDEPYFAEGAREMVVDGQWAVPHVNGKVTTDKPPLFFWLIALFSLPLGTVTPFTARLPSVLAALGTIFLTMRLGNRLFGQRTALAAGGILATTFMFWDKARWSQIDSLLCFLIWIALSAFEAYRAGDLEGRRAGLVFWAAAAFAVLAKGPVGFLLPLGIALGVLATDRRLASWRRFAPVTGPLLFAALIGAWIALAELGGPQEYSVWGALREHFIDRGVHGMHHKQPWWYFLGRLPVSLLPWTGLIPGALVLAWRRRSAGDRFVLGAALFVVIFFSISTEKRELYALPSLPAFALVAATLLAVTAGWDGSAEGERPVSSRWALVGQGIIGALLALVGVILPIANSRAEELPQGLTVAPAIALFLGGAATVVFCWRRRIVSAAVASAAGTAAVYLLVVATIYPVMEPRKSARAFTLTIQEATEESRAAGLPLLCYQLGNLPEHFAFHGNGLYTDESDDPRRLAAHLERSEKVFAVVHGGKLEPLSEDLRRRLWVVAEAHLARRDVLLVANFAHPAGTPLSPAS